MVILTIQKATGAGTVSFASPVSGEIAYVSSTTAGFISSDPTLTGAEVSTPLADGTKTNVLLLIASLFQKFDFPNRPVVTAGETLYFACGSKGTVLIYIAET